MTSQTYSRSTELLSASTSRLLVIDMQERFVPVISDFQQLTSGISRLVQAAQVLSVPVSATEQYPKGLGVTVPDLAKLIPHRPEKLRFSSAEVLDWVPGGGVEDGRHQVVLAGIETHICVLQTAMDLLAAGYDVYVAADLVRSRKPEDRELGLRRMSDAGVRLIGSEMAIFEWCEVAGTEQFKQVSKLVTGR